MEYSTLMAFLEWKYSVCSGPATSVRVFNSSYSDSDSIFTNNITIPGWCGNAPLEIDVGCCFNSYDLGYTNGIQSFESHFVSDVSHSPFPEVSKGHFYCHISYPVLDIYYLVSDICFDDYFQCTTDGLVVYFEPNCVGEIQKTIKYGLVGLSISQAINGNASVDFVQVSSGGFDIKWISVVPATLAVLGTRSLIEKLALAAAPISFIGFILTSGYYFMQYYKSRKHSQLFFGVTQFVWLARILVTIYDFYFQATELELQVINSVWCMADICTFMSALISAKMIIRILNWNSDIKRIYIYGILCTLHLFLAVPSYFYFLTYIPASEAIVGNFFEFYSNNLYYGWEIFVFLADLIPPILLLRRISTLSLQRMGKNKVEMFEKYKYYIVVLMTIDLTNLFSFVVEVLAQYYTLLAGGDIAFWCLWIIQLVNYLIHNLVILILYEIMTTMIKIKTNRESTAKIRKKEVSVNQQMIDSKPLTLVHSG
ncbi:hypothetical protein HDV06_001431 [Boothiomyces sp. JEL0866]|nr:hypothetical protein HDV06_001431 [Boothiomyces sp. JEL0866]